MGELKEKIIKKFKMIIKMFMKVIMAKLIPIILICFIVVLSISAFTYFITIDDGTYKEDDWSNTGFAVSEIALSETTIENIVKTDGGYGINIDLDAKVDEIIQTLKDKHGVLYKYISDKNVKEYLKTFIRAEIITQYPDLRNANKIGTETKSNEIQGCIQVHRASSSATDGQTQLLTYIDYDTFSSYISSGDSTATNHFSLDANGNLIVAGWTRVTTNVESNISGVENVKDKVEYNLLANSIDYRTLLKMYSMPFDFLWALIVMSEDEDFAYSVAQLALESKIIIAVQDNLTTVETETYEEYDIQEKINKRATITAVVDDVSHSKQATSEKENAPVNYYTRTNIKEETCRTNIDITYADTWLMEYTNTYSNVIPTGNTNKEEEPKRDTNYELKESGTLDSDSSISSALYDYKVQLCGGTAKYLLKLATGKVSGSIGTIYYNKYERAINQKTTTTVTTTYNTYTKGIPSLTEKNDRNSTESNFVTLFIEYDKANKNILSAPSWLFEMLEGNPKTSDMIDIVKYLLYKATDKDYGANKLDLNVYNSSSFSSVSISASSLLEAADIVHLQEQRWHYYNSTDELYWNNIEMSLNNTHQATCCATYVSCVIYIAGYFTEAQMNQFGNYNCCTTLYNDLTNAGWTIVNSYTELEPGDIVFMNYHDGGSSYDHVQIYAGDDTWYNAGSTSAIQRASPYSQGVWARQNFYVAVRAN